MKKEKADLEQLLNSLIQKGWRIENPKARISDVKYMYWLRELRIVYETDRRDAVRQYPIRFLVSKESWLWQFVCDREHRFIDKKNYEGIRLDKRLKNPYVDYDGVNTEYEWITSLDYQFRLIESSLKDESELEDFLLNSIKFD